jgi:flagellar basal-body rod protein FlgF/flagellar basal-body rod protein FlgG
MSYGLYLSAAGAQAQSQRLEIIANNLANVDTVGFKRELAIFQTRYAEGSQQGGAGLAGGAASEIGAGVQLQQTKTDFSPGALRRTGGASDVALEGDGFFQVRKGQEVYVTRAGNFRVSSNGELVTQQGYPVLSESHDPITINADGDPWEMTSAGELRQGSNVHSLAIVRPRSPEELVKVGENLFRPAAGASGAGAGVQPVPPAEHSVRPGYLETSGVQPMAEMVTMIETTRLAEANINLIQTQSQMLSDLISRVLKA